MPVNRGSSSILRTFRSAGAIAEIFEDLATEVTVEIDVSPVFLELHPDVTSFPNISPQLKVSG